MHAVEHGADPTKTNTHLRDGPFAVVDAGPAHAVALVGAAGVEKGGGSRGGAESGSRRNVAGVGTHPRQPLRGWWAAQRWRRHANKACEYKHSAPVGAPGGAPAPVVAAAAVAPQRAAQRGVLADAVAHAAAAAQRRLQVDVLEGDRGRRRGGRRRGRRGGRRRGRPRAGGRQAGPAQAHVCGAVQLLVCSTVHMDARCGVSARWRPALFACRLSTRLRSLHAHNCTQLHALPCPAAPQPHALMPHCPSLLQHLVGSLQTPELTTPPPQNCEGTKRAQGGPGQGGGKRGGGGARGMRRGGYHRSRQGLGFDLQQAHPNPPRAPGASPGHEGWGGPP